MKTTRSIKQTKSLQIQTAEIRWRHETTVKYLIEATTLFEWKICYENLPEQLLLP